MTIMKKLFGMAIMAAAALGFTSCERVSVYDPNYDVKAEEYQQNFTKQYGEIPADQNWDFYAQMINSMSTRAGAVPEIESISQPTDIDFTHWQTVLKPNVDNRTVGTHDFTLVSNGPFHAYAVWYCGWYPAYSKYDFEFGVTTYEGFFPVFGGLGLTGSEKPYSPGVEWEANPGYAANVVLEKGTQFAFYMKYKDTAGVVHTLYSNKGNATLLYQSVSTTEEVMVIGFEDQEQMNWGKEKPDFNDVVVYLRGNLELPLPEAKRFMCEDMGTTGDFDFNDIVFDVKPCAENGKAEVILQAAGGTLPAVLTVNGQEIGEVHALFGVSTSTMVNTGKGVTKDPVYAKIDVPTPFDLTTFDNFSVKVTYIDGTTREIKRSDDGTAPCSLMTPIKTRWMQETVNIEKGYPEFFKSKWQENMVKEYLY